MTSEGQQVDYCEILIQFKLFASESNNYWPLADSLISSLNKAAQELIKIRNFTPVSFINDAGLKSMELILSITKLDGLMDKLLGFQGWRIQKLGSLIIFGKLTFIF